MACNEDTFIDFSVAYLDTFSLRILYFLLSSDIRSERSIAIVKNSTSIF